MLVCFFGGLEWFCGRPNPWILVLSVGWRVGLLILCGWFHSQLLLLFFKVWKFVLFVLYVPPHFHIAGNFLSMKEQYKVYSDNHWLFITLQLILIFFPTVCGFQDGLPTIKTTKECYCLFELQCHFWKGWEFFLTDFQMFFFFCFD